MRRPRPGAAASTSGRHTADGRRDNSPEAESRTRPGLGPGRPHSHPGQTPFQTPATDAATTRSTRRPGADIATTAMHSCLVTNPHSPGRFNLRLRPSPPQQRHPDKPRDDEQYRDELRLSDLHPKQIHHHVHANLLDQKSLDRSEEHTSELQSRGHLVCRLLLEKKKTKQ